MVTVAYCHPDDAVSIAGIPVVSSSLVPPGKVFLVDAAALGADSSWRRLRRARYARMGLRDPLDGPLDGRRGNEC